MSTEIQTELDQTGKNLALRVIEDVHRSYYEKGGIRDTSAKLAEQHGSAAKHIYTLAKYAAKQRSKPADRAALFVQLCEFAESEYKKQHGVANLREALPSWGTYKSNILTGVARLELDPSEYRSERQFRIAADERKDELMPLRKPAKQRTDSLDQDPPPVTLMLEQYNVKSSLHPIVSQLVLESGAVVYGKTKDAMVVLRRAVEDLKPFVDLTKLQ